VVIDSNEVSSFTTDVVAALSTAQVEVLTSAQVDGLSTAQVVALTTTQVAVLTTAQVVALSNQQVGVITSTQAGAFSTAQIVAIEVNDISSLSTSVVPTLSTAQVAVLTSGQIDALSTAQVVKLSTAQVAVLTTAQVVALSAQQVGVLTSTQSTVFSTAQVAAIEANDISSLSTTALTALTTAQVTVFTTDQVVALGTAQVKAMSATQVASWSTAQLSSLTDGQVLVLNTASLSTAQTSVLVSTPLILDLNGDGVRTVGLDAGVVFDLEGSGQMRSVGWASPEDGFLVSDLNQDGIINNGTELFGSATVLPNGETANDGFQALATYDDNQDGVVNTQDSGWNSLKVWTDANQDGLSQAGELRSLTEMGITQLNLNPTESSEQQGGNWVGLISSYETADGQTHELADVWLHKGAAQDPQARVVGMAELIGAFADQPSSGSGQGSGIPLTTADVAGDAVGQLGALVPQMVQTLSLFDANGAPVNGMLGLASATQGTNILGEPSTVEEHLKKGALVSGKP
jgi:hypothetical protein